MTGGPTDETWPDPGLLDELRGRVAADQAAERGLGGWMRSRPPRTVALLAIIVSVALPGLLALMTWGPVLGNPDGAAVLLQLGLGATAMGPLLWLALRPLHVPPARPVVVWIAGASAAAVPAVASLLALHEHGEAGALGTSACLWVGTALVLPTLALFWAAQRHPGARAEALAAALFAGLGGYIAMALHCPITSALHLAARHAPIVALAAGIGLLRMARSRRPG